MVGLQSKTSVRAEALKSLAAQGYSMMESAEKIGINRNQANYLTGLFGIKYQKSSQRVYGEAVASPRDLQMAVLYKSGKTLAEIGEVYGITRERVRQLLKRTAVDAKHGGAAIRSEKNRKLFESRRDQRYLKIHGCTYAKFREINPFGRRLPKDGGPTKYQTPVMAFSRQRRNAKARGIEWELNFWQWWTVWQESGHWEKRGRGGGYVMCRHGDEGPYALGNIFIATGRENSSEGSKKRLDLPIGVIHYRKGNYETYKAHIQKGGKKIRLGSFKTPEEAGAAYLMALSSFNEAA